MVNMKTILEYKKERQKYYYEKEYVRKGNLENLLQDEDFIYNNDSNNFHKIIDFNESHNFEVLGEIRFNDDSEKYYFEINKIRQINK